MKKIFLLGECMVELRSAEVGVMQQSFAGDVYNSAVYLKRCFPDTQTGLISAVGKDSLSERMIECFKGEAIESQFVFQHDSKVPGMYLIELDDVGERSFTYWRSDAAARKVVDFLTQDIIEQLASGDMLFFSGISLAVIEESARELFWQKMIQLKTAGVKLVFDPNYRARLWTNEIQAQQQFKLAFELADIALPGVEDFSALYGIESAEGIIEFCQPYNIDELVIKNGPESVITVEQGQQLIHKIIPVTKVIDTTSAGDAFNGAYLGARLNGQVINDSVKMAAKAAGIVIQHPGAIAPKTAFEQAMSAV